jgi:hypothetical protein
MKNVFIHIAVIKTPSTFQALQIDLTESFLDPSNIPTFINFRSNKISILSDLDIMCTILHTV